MTPSEEMIPRRLRFKIASHVRTADRANQLFKFGSWNRVAGNCRESGRFKKRLKKLHPTCGYHNRTFHPPRPSKLQTNLQTNADKSADKVCLDSNLTNLFKNADARAAKIHQNADKPCLPKLQTRFVCCRQMLSILDLALSTSACSMT